MARQIIVEIVGDAKRFTKSIADAGKQSQGFIAGLTGALTLKGLGLVEDAFYRVGEAIVNSVGDASKLQQSIGAVESVFGDAADTIFKFGETADESMGLSKRQVNEMASIVGAQLKSMGFDVDEAAARYKSLQKRAADLAATFGGTTTDAIQAISSLLRGERDPIEKYGVSLKEADINARVLALGLDTSTTAAEKNAKAIAAMDLLMEQTASSSGQFARESESLAGLQQRLTANFENLSATLGEKLLPVAVDITEGILSVVNAFEMLNGKMPESMKEAESMTDGLLGLASSIPVFGASVGTLTDQINQSMEDAHQIVERKSNEIVRAVASKDDWFRNVNRDFASHVTEEINKSANAAVQRAGLLPAQLAAALRDNRSSWQKSLDQLGTDLENELTRAQELALLRGALTGKDLARGLASADPVVRAQALATKNEIVSRIRVLEGDARRIGAGAGRNLTNQFRNNVRGNVRLAGTSSANVQVSAGISTIRLRAFHQGGLVPGHPGEEVPALLQAGERVIAAKDANNVGNTYNIVVNALDPTQAATAVVRAIDEFERANGKRYARAS
jgi:hypothetical protein